MLNTTVRFDPHSKVGRDCMTRHRSRNRFAIVLEKLCFSKRNTQVFSLAYGIHKARAKLGCFFNWLNNPSVC